MNETCDSPQGQYTVRKQAEQAKTEAREAVELLEQAHELMERMTLCNLLWSTCTRQSGKLRSGQLRWRIGTGVPT
jgi:hypothetical protein